MSKLYAIFLTLFLGIVSLTGAQANSLVGAAQADSQRASKSLVESVRYRKGSRKHRCRTWRRECANLYGRGTYRWNACMNQPGAIRACSGPRYGRNRSSGYDYDGPPRFSCRTWRRNCAQLYGRRTYRWNACMNQPAAIRDCQNDY